MSDIAIQCGQRLRVPAGDELVVKGQFPASATAGQRMVPGTVEVSSRVAVKGVSSPNADVFLVQDGRVVALPAPQDMLAVQWDLAAGATRQVPGQVNLVSCAEGGEPVRPGSYELYARVVVTADDGTSVNAFGGPWPFEVR